MKEAISVGRTDVEIGDIVGYNGEEWEIYDIMFIQHVREGITYFRYVLYRGDCYSMVERHEFIYPVMQS